MNLLTLSGSLVTTSAAGKAVGTWAARRQFGGSATVDLYVDGHRWTRWSNSALPPPRVTCMGIFGEGAQGFWSGARGGGGESVHNFGVDRDDG